MQAAAWLQSDLEKLSYAEARALLSSIHLDAHDCTLREVLLRQLFLEPDAPFHHARTALFRVLVRGPRSATHVLNVILMLIQWRPNRADAWREARIASLVLALSEAEWGEMDIIQFIALRVWLYQLVARRPAAEGITLIHHLLLMSRAHYPAFENDRWASECLDQWLTVHAGHPVSASLVHDLLLSYEPCARALAYTLLGTHPVMPEDLASPVAP